MPAITSSSLDYFKDANEGFCWELVLPAVAVAPVETSTAERTDSPFSVEHTTRCTQFADDRVSATDISVLVSIIQSSEHM